MQRLSQILLFNTCSNKLSHILCIKNSYFVNLCSELKCTNCLKRCKSTHHIWFKFYLSPRLFVCSHASPSFEISIRVYFCNISRVLWISEVFVCNYWQLLCCSLHIQLFLSAIDHTRPPLVLLIDGILRSLVHAELVYLKIAKRLIGKMSNLNKPIVGSID